jgi:hypothetical protein
MTTSGVAEGRAGWHNLQACGRHVFRHRRPPRGGGCSRQDGKTGEVALNARQSALALVQESRNPRRSLERVRKSRRRFCDKTRDKQRNLKHVPHSGNRGRTRVVRFRRGRLPASGRTSSGFRVCAPYPTRRLGIGRLVRTPRAGCEPNESVRRLRFLALRDLRRETGIHFRCNPL